MKTPPLYLIQSFLAFTQAKNISEAARSLQISQPALTLHLKNFEIFFAEQIFTTQGRRKILTAFGENVRDLLHKRFANLDEDLKSLVDQSQKPEKILVRIGGRSEILNQIAPSIVFPGSLHFIFLDGAAASQSVLDRKVEIAISNHVAKSSPLHAKKLFQSNWNLIAPKKWFKKDLTLKAAFEFLGDKPLLTYKEAETSLELLIQYYGLKKPLQSHRTLSHWPSLIAMTDLEQGWAVAPDTFPVGSSTISIPIASSIIPPTQFFALYRKESSAQAWFKELVQSIQRAF